MAKFLNGIFGSARGKLGGVVFGSWKGIDYGRAYVIPNNPQTVNQQTNRSLFGSISGIISHFLDVTARRFVDPIVAQQSGFNRLVQLSERRIRENVDVIDCCPPSEFLVVTDGELEDPLGVNYNYDPGTGDLQLEVLGPIPQPPANIFAQAWAVTQTDSDCTLTNEVFSDAEPLDGGGQAMIEMNVGPGAGDTKVLHVWLYGPEPQLAAAQACSLVLADNPEEGDLRSSRDWSGRLDGADSLSPIELRDRENREIVMSGLGTEAPVNVAPPQLSTTLVEEGDTITVDDGVWQGGVDTIEYQWQNDGGDGTWVDIVGATNQDYTATSDDVDTHLRAQVTATNAQGASTHDSNESELVRPPA